MTRIALVLVAATVTASLAEAQSLSFDRLALQLNQGDRITVTGRDGQELRGRIVDLSSATLSLQTGGRRRYIDEADISVIRRSERDSLKNGGAIGLAAGAAFAVWLFGKEGKLHQAGFVLPASLLYGSAGMAAGMGLDSLHRGSQVVYRKAPSSRRLAVSPVLSPERRSLAVSFGF